MYGEDDFPEDDRAVVNTVFGRMVVPVSVRKMSEEGRESYVQLQRVGLQLQHLEDHLRVELVPAAREAGHSWSVIGAALGITGEGARKRYDREG